MNRDCAIKWCIDNGFSERWFWSSKLTTPKDWRCVTVAIPYCDPEYQLVNIKTGERISKDDLK